MSREAVTGKGHGPRKSVLELAPLELDCMNALWPMGEGTVREIRAELAARRPRAYTTIMTIMDRLARKGVVERHKVGRAYLYRPNLSAAEARARALGQVVEGFFGGSMDAVVEQLNSRGMTAPAAAAFTSPRIVRPEKSAPARAVSPVKTEPQTEPELEILPSRLDETLL